MRPITTFWPSFSSIVWSIARTRTLRSTVSLTNSSLCSRVRITSTKSFGRMKPPAPVSAEISVAAARIPAGKIADMNPEPSALTSFCSRIGSPTTKGERATEPFNSSIAFGRAARLMKSGPAAFTGHGCQERFSGVTERPTAMSVLATRISTVSDCGCTTLTTGAGASPRDNMKASPPAARAIPKTAIRAARIRSLPKNRDDWAAR